MLIAIQQFLVRLISYSLPFKCWGSTSIVILALCDDCRVLDKFWVSNSLSQFISYIFVETYQYYINSISNKFWFTQCQTMIQLGFLNFQGSNFFETFIMYFCFNCLFITKLMWLLCMLLQYLILGNLLNITIICSSFAKNTVRQRNKNMFVSVKAGGEKTATGRLGKIFFFAIFERLLSYFNPSVNLKNNCFSLTIFITEG